jgi:Rieske Fe-S protein
MCANQSLETVPLDPGKRRLLGWLVGIINVVVAGTILGPVLGFIGSPIVRKSTGQWVPILDDHELPEGKTREVSFTFKMKDGYLDTERKYTVYLRRFPDRVVAFDPACTHLGCRIKFQDDKLRYFCPCHGGVFDDQGRVVAGPPPEGLKTHPTKIENGKIYVLKMV